MSSYKDNEIREVQNALEAFVVRQFVHPSDREALLRFLRHEMQINQNTEEVHDPIPDQLNRIRLVHKAKGALKSQFGDTFVFTHLHQIAILLLAHNSELERVIRDNPILLRNLLDYIEPLLARFLQSSDALPADVNLPIPLAKPGEPEVNRSKGEKKKARQRDGNRCLVTNAAAPDVCHIIPFKLNSKHQTTTDSRVIFMTALPWLMSRDDQYQLYDLLFPYHDSAHVLGGSDKQWNMLSLSPLVHRYWSRCFFAFKWVGVKNPDPMSPTQTVQLEFRWVPRSIATALGNGLDELPKGKYGLKGNAFRAVNVEAMSPENTSELLSDCINNSSLTSTTHPRYRSEESPTLVHHDSGLPIKSGYIVNVERVRTKEIDNMKLVIDLQYIAIRLAGMSGAADAIEYLDPRVPPPHNVYESDTGQLCFEFPTLPELPFLRDEEEEEEETLGLAADQPSTEEPQEKQR